MLLIHFILFSFGIFQSQAGLYELPEFKSHPIQVHDPMDCVEKLAHGIRYKIGRGYVGKVYRVKEFNGQSHIEKIYRDLDTFQNDLFGFDLITKSKGIKSIRVLSHSEPPKMILEDVRGETVQSYFDRLPTADLKEALKSWMKSELRRLEAAIVAYMQSQPQLYGYTKMEINLEEQTYIKPRGGELYILWLHPENLLIDTSGNLVVIDPY